MPDRIRGFFCFAECLSNQQRKSGSISQTNTHHTMRIEQRKSAVKTALFVVFCSRLKDQRLAIRMDR
jgi:hypothetical protein